MQKPISVTTKMTIAIYAALIFSVLTAFIPEAWIMLPKADSLDSASRMVNALFAGMITGMAFLLTLSAQLYTPRLVGVIMKNPLIISTMLFLGFANFMIMLQSSWPQNSPLYGHILITASTVSILTIFISIPVLTFMTRFLRPDYFLPQIVRQADFSMSCLAKGKLDKKHYINVIRSWDMITNIALTAIQRDDRQLIRLSMKMLDDSLHRIVTKYEHLDAAWRSDTGYYIPGMTSDSCTYLRKTGTWPEAYLLFKKEQILKSTTDKQNDVVSESCKNVHQIVAIAIDKKLDHILELNLIFMNSLMRAAVDRHNIELFQLISYHYRVNAILIRNDMYHRREIFSGWTFYARTARKSQLHFGFETILYDLGSVLMTIASENEPLAQKIYEESIAPFIKYAKELEVGICKVAWRVTVKTYWQVKYLKCDKLAENIMTRFLSNDKKHFDVFADMNRFNSPLNWELGDRLMNYTYFPEETLKLACHFFAAKGFRVPAHQKTSLPDLSALKVSTASDL